MKRRSRVTTNVAKEATKLPEDFKKEKLPDIRYVIPGGAPFVTQSSAPPVKGFAPVMKNAPSMPEPDGM